MNQAAGGFSDGMDEGTDTGILPPMDGSAPQPALEAEPFQPAGDSMTTFSREREGLSPTPVYPPVQEQPQPAPENSDFNGTGGLY